MNIAVLSGKGGTGKTFVSVNLAVAAKSAVYIDCDVEEPNGRIFLKPQNVNEEEVAILLPEFLESSCNGCRKCVDFCKFNALIYIKNKPKVFPEVCHSCGGCALVCEKNAVKEVPHTIGKIEVGNYKEMISVTGILNIGEVSGVPVIQRAISKGESFHKEITVIDCPPGSACSATESVMDADYCLLVVEPTAFGFHNFKMVYELVRLLGKKIGIIINKQDFEYQPLEDFCEKECLPILLRIPYDRTLANLQANGKIVVEENSEMRKAFETLLKNIGGETR